MSQTPQPDPIQAKRPTFADDFFARGQQFATDLLLLLPELESVAVVPSWTIEQDRVPFGLIMGRHGPLRTSTEMMNILRQLNACTAFQLKRLVEYMQSIDDEASRMGKEINAKARELERLEQLIADRRQTLETQTESGPPEPPGDAG